MDEKRLAALLAYCRVEKPLPGELVVLEGLCAAAEGYLEGAGISPPPEGTPRRAQYDRLIDALVLDGFDQRGAQAEGGRLTENHAFRRALVQMKLTEGWEGANTQPAADLDRT